MRPQRLVLGVMALLLMILATGTDALACSCGPSGPSCQNTFQSDAVFSGTVRTITIIPEEGPPLRPNEFRFPRGFRVEFDVIAAFRGVETPTVTVLTSGNGASCGYTFKQGERYLVY